MRISGHALLSPAEVDFRLSGQAPSAEVPPRRSPKRCRETADATKSRQARVVGSTRSLSGGTGVRRCVLWPVLLAAVAVSAAGAGERLALVVNRNSWGSRSVANYFVSLRQVPAQNIILLDYRDAVDGITLDRFQDQILKPVWRELQRRGLEQQVDSIIYSSDFPYAINFSAREAAEARFTEASLTALTFLHSQLSAPGTAFASLTSNPYAVESLKTGQSVSFSSFLGNHTRRGKRRPYYLSTMLGYTSGRGNSLLEVISYLRRSALADGSYPDGMFCFMKHSDDRSVARAPQFEPVVEAMTKAGLEAQVFTGKQVPPAGIRVAGAMLGSSVVDWNPLASVLPGAICENFTSYGGILRDGSSQTPLTDLLRLGAAGSSGTVVEPFAIANKFPHAILYIHYARGCTLAESYYQSVLGPYQLLIVGDPLCRPWGIRPEVRFTGIAEGDRLQGTTNFAVEATVPGGKPADQIDLFLDGKEIARVRPQQSFRFDTTRHAEGHHQWTAIAAADSAVGATGLRHLPFTIANGDRSVELKVIGKHEVPWGEPIRCRLNSKGCGQLKIKSQGEIVAQLAASSGEVAISTGELGLGPILLEAVGSDLNRPGEVISSPALVQILPPPLERPRPNPRLARARPGFWLMRANGTRELITETRKRDWPETAGVPARGKFSIQAFVDVPKPDVYQFRAVYDGTLVFRFNGRTRYSGPASKLRYGVPLHLAPGSHEIQCEVTLAGAPRVDLEFGNQGSPRLSGDNSRCPE